MLNPEESSIRDLLYTTMNVLVSPLGRKIRLHRPMLDGRHYAFWLGHGGTWAIVLLDCKVANMYTETRLLVDHMQEQVDAVLPLFELM